MSRIPTIGNTGIENGHTITDDNGQLLVYRSPERSWIYSGCAFSDKPASFIDDGMITPSIYSLLVDVKRYHDDGVFVGPKIIGNPNVYWYYLRSIGLPLAISVESKYIYIDIDPGKLSSTILSRVRCRGAKGKPGQQGDRGPTGLSAGNELTMVPTIDKQKLTIAVEIPIPLDTEISIRLYEQGDLKAEVRSASGSERYIYPENPIKLDEDKSKIAIEGGRVDAEFYRADGIAWNNNWRIKIRQCGPKGDPGPNGASFLQVEENSIADPNIRHNKPIKTIRRNTRSDLIFIKAGVDDSMPVSHLKTHSDISFFTRDITIGDNSDFWAAIEPTIDNAKGIYKWNFIDQFEDTITPNRIALTDDTGDVYDLSLVLPDWTPLRVIGYGGWTGFEEAEDIPCCEENLFLCAQVKEVDCG